MIKPEDVALCHMCHRVTSKEPREWRPSHTEVSRCMEALTLHQYIVAYAKTLFEDAIVSYIDKTHKEKDYKDSDPALQSLRLSTKHDPIPIQYPGEEGH